MVVLRVQQLPGSCRPGRAAHPATIQLLHRRLRLCSSAAAASRGTVGGSIQQLKLLQTLCRALPRTGLWLSAAVQAACTDGARDSRS